MVRMSDILKRSQDNPEEEKRNSSASQKEAAGQSINQKAKDARPKSQPPKSVPPKQSQEAPPANTSNAPKEAVIPDQIDSADSNVSVEARITKAMKETGQVKENSAGLYAEALNVAKRILGKIEQGKPFYSDEIERVVDAIINRLFLQDSDLLSLIYADTPENFLYGHLVNVCILSIKVGIEMKFNKSKLITLGISSLIHDIGMTKVADKISANRKLDEEEYKKVMKHPTYGVELMSREPQALKEELMKIIGQEHERADGSGYPDNLKGEDILDCAKIIGLVDIYEALTHDRPHRRHIQPHEAVREIFKMEGESFEGAIIKALIKSVGIYPIGSWVELSTGETGKVVDINEDFPLRPIVNVLFGPDGSKLRKIKQTNLAKNMGQYVKNTISSDKLAGLGETS